MHRLYEPEAALKGGMDVRIKLVMLTVALALVLTHDGVLFPLLIISCSLVLALVLGVRLRTLAIRFIEPFAVVVVLVSLKALSGTEELWSYAFITVYRDGLIEGLHIALRLGAAISAVTLVSVTTPFMEFFGGLRWFGVPRTFVDVSMFACRYVTMFFDEAMVIYRSQRNRLGYDGLRRSFQSFGVLAGSLVIRAFDHAEDTTTALRQRGYEGTMPVLERKPFRFVEVAGACVTIVVMAVLWKLP